MPTGENLGPLHDADESERRERITSLLETYATRGEYEKGVVVDVLVAATGPQTPKYKGNTYLVDLHSTAVNN